MKHSYMRSFFFFIMNGFPNDLCVFLTDVDIIIKQISHWLKFTINNLGFVWGDALCKTQASGQNTSGSREWCISFFRIHFTRWENSHTEQLWKILVPETALASATRSYVTCKRVMLIIVTSPSEALLWAGKKKLHWTGLYEVLSKSAMWASLEELWKGRDSETHCVPQGAMI